MSGARIMAGQRPNDRLGWVLIALVVLAPLPLGSNRPAFWAGGAALLAVVALFYLLRLAQLGSTLRYDLSRLAVPLLLAGLYVGWLIMQTLPLGTFEIELPQGTFMHDAISVSTGDTKLAILRVSGYAILFALMMQVAVNRARAQTLAWVLFAAITFWSLYGLVALIQFGDTMLFFQKWAYFGSATGPFVNRNSFATYLAMGLILGLGLVLGALTRPGNRRVMFLSGDAMLRALAIIGLLLILAALFRTQSRMGLFAGLMGAGLTVSLILVRRGGLGRRGWLLVPLAVMGILSAGLYFYGGQLIDRVGQIDSAAATRGDLYVQILDMIGARPWTGWGGDSFETAFRAFREDPVSATYAWERAHSTYLAHWAETGLIFGSIPILLVAIAFWRCLSMALTRQNDIVLPAIGAGVILTGGVHSLVDFSLEMQANVWTFLVIIALAISNRGTDYRRTARSDEKANKAEPALT